MIGTRFCLIFALLVISSIVYIFYTTNTFTTSSLNSLTSININPHHYRNLSFDKNSGDVFSFVHIQKTGGTTMEKHLIHNIKDSNCKCGKSKKPSCMCYRTDVREIWLVCRYIQPKWPCGLHPDYATLKECTPRFINDLYGERPRRYFYGTTLRNPLHRFLSEFRHTQRGASWEASASLCRGELLMNRIASSTCFEGKMWFNLTMEKFVACPFNLAINRQTWMMSNISRVTCDFDVAMTDKGKRDELLAIAKRNVLGLAYFGLLEYPVESQFVFEKTFNLEFIEPFQKWETGFAKEYLKQNPLSDAMIARIIKLNSLDFELYKYAKGIFFERYAHFREKHGPPRVQEKPLKSKFDMGKRKVGRLINNLPRSKDKAERIKQMMRRENDIVNRNREVT